jgi:transcriptional regulator with XRE-family HTH domain
MRREKLIGWRKKKGLTQASLAAFLRCGQSWVNQVELGTISKPDTDRIELYAHALGRSVTEVAEQFTGLSLVTPAGEIKLTPMSQPTGSIVRSGRDRMCIMLAKEAPHPSAREFWRLDEPGGLLLAGDVLESVRGQQPAPGQFVIVAHGDVLLFGRYRNDPCPQIESLDDGSRTILDETWVIRATVTALHRTL